MRACAGDYGRRPDALATSAEGERFELSDDVTAVNGFRDRAETAAMPHHNWSLGPGGIQGGMTLGRGVFCDPSAAERDSAGRM